MRVEVLLGLEFLVELLFVFVRELELLVELRFVFVARELELFVEDDLLELARVVERNELVLLGLLTAADRDEDTDLDEAVEPVFLDDDVLREAVVPVAFLLP